jgi:hypothetical protein
MILLALILLASSQRVEIVDGVFPVPSGKWHDITIGLRQGRPVVIAAGFAVRSGSEHVRLELLRREDLERLREGRPNGFLAMTPPGAAGRFRYLVRAPGDYVVLLDNRNADATTVSLRVELDFGGLTVTRPTLLRQLAIILISFAVFFTIVTYSVRRLLRGMRR